MKTLSNRVVAITGAASGIGRALALRFAQEGSKLAISDIDSERLDETLDLVHQAGCHEVMRTTLDVADREGIYAWKDEILEHFGEVHIIINNAGVSLRATVEDMTYEDFEWVMNINFWGVVSGTRAFLPHLKEVDEAHIVNVSSVFGIIGVPTQSAYNAAKFAVRGFTESLREEMLAEKTNVGVSCVHPGGIKTNIVRNGRIREMSSFKDHIDLAEQFETEMARTTAEDAADTIVDGMLAGKPRILIGADAHIIDSVARLLPAGYQKLLVKIYEKNLQPREA